MDAVLVDESLGDSSEDDGANGKPAALPRGTFLWICTVSNSCKNLTNSHMYLDESTCFFS